MFKHLSILLALVSVVHSAAVYNPYDGAVKAASTWYSQYYRVIDLNAKQPITFNIKTPTYVYGSSSGSSLDMAYEKNIIITYNNKPVTLADLSKQTNAADGSKQPASFGLTAATGTITIMNNNVANSTSPTAGLIYLVAGGPSNPYSTIYDAPQLGSNFNLAGKLKDQYLTMISLSGGIALSRFGQINGLTALSLYAGGLNEALGGNSNYDLYDLSKRSSKTNATLYVWEPIVTLHKALTTSNSSFSCFAQAQSISANGNTTVSMDWGDVSLAMSSNYLLFPSSPIMMATTFNAVQNNSQFSVTLSGNIDSSTLFNIVNNGYKGSTTQSLNGTGALGKTLNLPGNTLVLTYTTTSTSSTNGFLAQVTLSQPASTIFAATMTSLYLLIAALIRA